MTSMMSTDKMVYYACPKFGLKAEYDKYQHKVTLFWNREEVTQEVLFRNVKSMPNNQYKEEVEIFISMVLHKRLRIWNSMSGNKLKIR